MQVRCTSCGAEVPARDINLDRLLAKCEKCDAIFDIGGLVPRADGQTQAGVRRAVPMPKRITIVSDELSPGIDTYRGSAAPNARLVVERSWFSASLFFLLFFCVFWDGFLVVWYIGLSQAKGNSGSIVAAIFPIFHVGAGVFITYTMLAGFLNKTRIAIESGNLVIRHGPLPWPGNRTIPTDDLAQLFCDEQVGSKGPRSYSLNAMTKSSDKLVLLKGLPDADQALYLEQLLEQRLGLVDVPVAGEFV